MEELRKEKLRKETLDEITADWASQNQIEQPSYAFYLQTRLVNALLKQKLSKQVTEEEFKKWTDEWLYHNQGLSTCELTGMQITAELIFKTYTLIPKE